jgi:hypothetical protein
MKNMTNQPNKIYLNIGADGECQDFEELVGVSWSDSRINDDDLEYISVSSVLARIKELEAEVENEDSVYSEASCRFRISELKNLIKL